MCTCIGGNWGNKKKKKSKLTIICNCKVNINVILVHNDRIQVCGKSKSVVEVTVTIFFFHIPEDISFNYNSTLRQTLDLLLKRTYDCVTSLGNIS